ncbi:MAG: MBL fold metallo-hydrolase [Firmicutes bacterium]|nr:MBL fold metallo-hydrolase [Bacillota bacterium]
MANSKKRSRNQKFAEIIEARSQKNNRSAQSSKGKKKIIDPKEQVNLTKADVTLQQAMEIFERNENADLYLQNLLQNNFQDGKNFRWSKENGKGEVIKSPAPQEEPVPKAVDTEDQEADDQPLEENEKIKSIIYEDALFSDQLLVLYLRLRYENKILRSAKHSGLIDDYENLEIESEHLQLLWENFDLLAEYAEEEIKIRALALQNGIKEAMKRQQKLIAEAKAKYPWLEEELHARRNPQENQIALFDSIEPQAVEEEPENQVEKLAQDEAAEIAQAEVKTEEPIEKVEPIKKTIDGDKIARDPRLTLRRQPKDPIPGRPMVNNVPLLMVDQTDYTDWHHYLYPQTGKTSNSAGSSHVLVKAIAGGNDNDAAAYILEIVENNKRILIDAGLRLDQGVERFPDYASAPRPDLILLSRANYRHIGALPYLSKLWPGVPVWTSIETAKLLPHLFKAMSQQGELADGPIYTEEEIKNVVYRGIPWQEAHYPFRDDFSVTLYPAGYLPGAASFSLDSSENSIFISADFALHEERIAKAAAWPQKDYDVALLNLTLAQYSKFNRFEMEEVMLEKIEEVLLRGGIALFPVNEIGRESSILAMLRRGVSDGLISKVPFYIDGRIEKYLKIIEEISPPDSPKEPSLDAAYSLQWSYSKLTENNRYRLGDQAACLIVNSSMLKEAAPGFQYLKEILADPASAIFLPAMNDGFVDLRSELENHWRVIPARKAELLYYQWPGMAARSDVLKALELLNPRVALFVHGEPEAHRELRTVVPGNIVRRSLANNETIRIRPQGLDD